MALVIQVCKWMGAALFAFTLFLGLLWSSSAIYIDARVHSALRVVLVVGLWTIAVLAFWKVRPYHKAVLVPLGLSFSVWIWWLSLKPQATRDWAAEYAQLPSGTFDGRQLIVHNVRSFDYRSTTDFEERWETRSYDLDELEGIDLFFSHWGSPHVAHTIMSWQFRNSPPLAISIETRREGGEVSVPYLGFYRQYELYYVVADESDLIRLRTNFRKEDVYLYRLLASRDDAEKLLRDYFETINELDRRPRWYNAFAQNCTTTIRYHLRSVDGGGAWDWRLLANGYLPEVCYERGTVSTALPFEELRAKSRISEKANLLKNDADYSEGIRVGLPERPVE